MNGRSQQAPLSIKNFLYRYSFDPHISSFDFALGDGLEQAVRDLSPQYVQFPDGTLLKLWIESVKVLYPTSLNLNEPVYPKDCRLASTTYNAPAYARLGYSLSYTMAATSSDSSSYDVAPRFLQKCIGRLPIMVQSTYCQLRRSIDNKMRRYRVASGCGSSSPQKEDYTQARANILIQHGEDVNDHGGYFIVNGNEKICRLLCMTRRNYPIVQRNDSYKKTLPNALAEIISIRCCRPDSTMQTNTLHPLINGDIYLRFNWRRRVYLLPVILLCRCWKDVSDREIYQSIVAGNYSHEFVIDKVESMLRIWRSNPDYSTLDTPDQCLSHVGSLFRSVYDSSPLQSDIEVGKRFLDSTVFVHLSTDIDKFYLMISMIQKLYSFLSGNISQENRDSPCYQEILLPGHIYLMILKECLYKMINNMCGIIQREMEQKVAADIKNSNYVKYVFDRLPDIGPKLEYFISTGNAPFHYELQLRQNSGFTTIADRLNHIRFLSHFRSVHRGQFFLKVRTTTARKLHPDTWGFFCPVHTPDGEPCGLLNHLTCHTSVTNDFSREITQKRKDAVTLLLLRFGMNIMTSFIPVANHIPIILDGCVMGTINKKLVNNLVYHLRLAKTFTGMNSPDRTLCKWINTYVGIIDSCKLQSITKAMYSPLSSLLPEIRNFPEDLEIVNMTDGKHFPVLALSSGPARMRRPVINLTYNLMEWISPLEQTFLHIKCPNRRKSSHLPKWIRLFPPNNGTNPLSRSLRTLSTLTNNNSNVIGDVESISHIPAPRSQDFISIFTHREVDPSFIFSFTASLTPFSEYNQSPRNMYQCQMAKQTMGALFSPHKFRFDNTIYSIITPQIPIVRTVYQSLLDDYPTGTNAILAVISYTGYDMEDAMIINKSSYERGLCDSFVYKSEYLDFSKEGSAADSLFVYLSNTLEVAPSSGQPIGLFEPSLDQDGLPFIGQQLEKGDPFYVTYNEVTQKHSVNYYHKTDPCVVEDIVITSIDKREYSRVLPMVQRAVIKMRIHRRPMTGDKFSSRHGQKGILSQLWPVIDMPFTSRGMTPDIIINPNAFPSRMTIGMLIESLAGKTSSLLGYLADATPFESTDIDITNKIGEQLRNCGFDYYGNETMYSGKSGVKMEAKVFIGVVYYQRLRHMVGDKYQVRSTGMRNRLTRQPIKGRKKGGGVRFGEMERDSLLAHGVSYLLHDRLLICSDRHIAHACKLCGSLISPVRIVQDEQDASDVPYAKLFPNNILSNILGVKCDDTASSYWKCTLCNSKKGIVKILVPYVLIYLIAELAAVNVKVSVKVI